MDSTRHDYTISNAFLHGVAGRKRPSTQQQPAVPMPMPMPMLTSDQLRRDWQRQRRRQREEEEQQQRVNSSMASKGKGKGRISSDEEGSGSNSDNDNDSDESSGADVSASRAAPKSSRPPSAAAPIAAPKRGVQVEVFIDNTQWRPPSTVLASSSRQQQPRRSLPLSQPTAGASEPRKNRIMRKSTGEGEAIRKAAAAIVATVSDSSDECVLSSLLLCAVLSILTLFGRYDTETATRCGSPTPKHERQRPTKRDLGQCRCPGTSPFGLDH